MNLDSLDVRPARVYGSKLGCHFRDLEIGTIFGIGKASHVAAQFVAHSITKAPEIPSIDIYHGADAMKPTMKAWTRRMFGCDLVDQGQGFFPRCNNQQLPKPRIALLQLSWSTYKELSKKTLSNHYVTFSQELPSITQQGHSSSTKDLRELEKAEGCIQSVDIAFENGIYL